MKKLFCSILVLFLILNMAPGGISAVDQRLFIDQSPVQMEDPGNPNSDSIYYNNQNQANRAKADLTTNNEANRTPITAPFIVNDADNKVSHADDPGFPPTLPGETERNYTANEALGKTYTITLSDQNGYSAENTGADITTSQADIESGDQSTPNGNETGSDVPGEINPGGTVAENQISGPANKSKTTSDSSNDEAGSRPDESAESRDKVQIGEKQTSETPNENQINSEHDSLDNSPNAEAAPSPGESAASGAEVQSGTTSTSGAAGTEGSGNDTGSQGKEKQNDSTGTPSPTDSSNNSDTAVEKNSSGEKKESTQDPGTDTDTSAAKKAEVDSSGDLAAVKSSASSTYDYGDDAGADAMYNIKQTQYSCLNGSSEFVSPQTGDLTLKIQDIYLPGRNGFDLDISRIYKSNQALTGDFPSWYQAQDWPFLDYSTHELETSNLGMGWSFCFPSVGPGSSRALYHDGQGAVYPINFDLNDEDHTPSNLENYDKADLLFSMDTSYQYDANTTSFCSLAKADHSKQYFGQNGRLLAMVDRFGNQIRFEYQDMRVSNCAPDVIANTDFTGVWTGGGKFRYIEGLGKDDNFTYQFNNNTNTTTYYETSYSRTITVLPNTKYVLDGYILNQLSTPGGYCNIAIKEYDRDDVLPNFISCTTNSIYQGGDWQYFSTTWTTNSNTEYIQLIFNIRSDSNSAKLRGTASVDGIRLDKLNQVYSKITDSIGRTINFTYDDKLYDPTSTDAGNVVVTVNDPGNNQAYRLIYGRSKSMSTSNNQYVQDTRLSPVLSSVDNGEFISTYLYQPNSQWFYYASSFGSGYGSVNQMTLKQVNLRNTSIYYDYQQVTKKLGGAGFYKIHRIYDRYEIPAAGQSPEYKQVYSYLGKYDGSDWPLLNDETGYGFIGYLEPDDPKFHFTTTMQQDNGYKIEYKSSCGKTESIVETVPNWGTSTTKYTYNTQFKHQPGKINYEYVGPQSTVSLEKDYTYNTWGGVATETRPLDQTQLGDANLVSKNTTTYTYNPDFKFVTCKSYFQSAEKQLSESTNYDSLGRMITFTNAKGEVTSYSYQDQSGSTSYPGNVTSISINLPDGKIAKTAHTYDSTHAFPVKTTQYYTQDGVAKSSITKKTFEYLWGKPLTETDALGHVTTYQYDGQGRLSDVLYPPSTGKDGSYTREDIYTYSDITLNGRPAFKVLKTQFKNGTLSASSAACYDAHGNILDQAVWDGERSVWLEQKNYFNVYGQLQSSIDKNNHTTTYTFDAGDHVTSITDANNNSRKYEYDMQWGKTSYMLPSGGSRENDYLQRYDYWGRRISQSGYPDGLNQPASAVTTTHTYDIAGNCTATTDPRGNTTRFGYDELNRLTWVSNPLGEMTDYTYDRLGGLKNTIQSEGSTNFTTSRAYDERGLQISKQEPGGPTYTHTYQYNAQGLPTRYVDPDSQATTYQYYSDNRLKSSTCNSSKITRYYHPLGTIERYTTAGGGEGMDYTYYSSGLTKQKTLGGLTINYEYDNNSNLTKMTDPYSYPVNYQYDSLNRPQTISAGGLAFNYEYYGDGMIKAVNYPGNIIRTEYTYDNMNRLKTLINKKGSQILSSFTYGYDKNGNIVSISDNKTSSISHYAYDALNRLSTMTRPDGSQVQYTYDSRGNRKQKTPQATGGNFIAGDFAYNNWDQLASFTTGGQSYTYTYDAEGNRTKKTGNGSTTRYISDNNGRVIAEANGSNQVTVEIIWGNRPLARKVGSTYYYYLYNGHGDVIALTDASGNIKNSYAYDEWGNILNKTETIANPIRYAGEYYDEESGLYYLRARYYDPTIGRFISKDSEEGQIDNPLTLNLYTYCNNNPINFVDPTGHSPEGTLRAGIYSGIRGVGISPSPSINTIVTSGSKEWDEGMYESAEREWSETPSTVETVLDYANKGTAVIAGGAGALGIASLCVPPPEGEALAAGCGTVAIGFTGAHATITATQEYLGYITPEEANRAYLEDIVGAGTGGASMIAKEASAAYYTVKSGLLGIAGALDSLTSGTDKAENAEEE